jgi:hypothetical protein
MVRRRVMFGKVIRFVHASFSPLYSKLALSDSIADPIEPHVHSFRTFLFNGIVNNPGGCAVIGNDDSGWLRVPEFFQSCSDRTRFPSVVKQSGELCLGCTGHHFFQNSAQYVNCAVGRGWFIINIIRR